MEDSIKNLSVRGVKWSAVEGILSHGTTFIVGLVIARILTPDDYGLVGMLTIFMAVSQAFVNSGFSTALIRMKARTVDDYATAFCFNVTAGIFIYGILFLTAPVIASFYGLPILKDILRVYAVILVISALQIVPRTKLMVAVDFKTQAIIGLIAALVSGGTGIGMAYAGYGVWALVWQAIVSVSVSVVLLWGVTGWKPWDGRLAKHSFHKLFSFGSKLLGSSLLHILYKNISALVIGKYYMPADLGLYSRGQQIAEVPSMHLTGIVRRVSYPVLARLQDDNERLARVYRQYLGMSSLVIFFLMVLLAAVAEPLILLLLTEKWLGAVPFLRIFCLALIFDHICQINNNMMYVKGRSDLFLRLEIIKKLVVCPLLLFAIPYGVIAICFVPVAHELVDLVLGTYYIHRLLGIHKINPLKDYGIYLFCALIACIPAFLLCLTDLSPWLSLPIAVLLSSSLYLAMLWKEIKRMKGFVMKRE